MIIFGIGGVGSWCAESLVRSGIQDLTIVDSDRISVSNINRQLHATTATVGAVKTEVLKSRLLEINPAAHITGIQRVYNDKNSASFGLENYDYIVDAIDSLSYKIDLIRKATRTPATLFSSMGASLKIDPTRVKVAEFFDVKGCPLGSIVRKRIRRGDLPAKKFLCVYSDEILETGGSMSPEEEPKSSPPLEAPVAGDPSLAAHDWSDRKAVINGTIAHITAIFGFTLAGLIIQDIYRRYQSIATANEPEPAPNP